MGALAFEPHAQSRRQKATALELAELADHARRLIEGNTEDPDGLAQLIQTGTSAGGQKSKAIVAWNRTTGEFRAGNMAAPKGFEQWLLKFDSSEVESGRLRGVTDSGRVEHTYNLLAQAAGVQVSESRLIEDPDATGGPRAHFMTRRFDRGPGNERIHMQTLCAVAGLDYSFSRAHDYANYLLTVSGLNLGEQAMAEAFRRMVFNVAARNGDDHTKNFSFLAQPDGAWSLAPAYDLTFHPMLGTQLLSVNGKYGDITLRDVMAVADRFEIPDARRIVKDVLSAVDAWPAIAAAQHLDTGIIRFIADSHRETTSLLRR